MSWNGLLATESNLRIVPVRRRLRGGILALRNCYRCLSRVSIRRALRERSLRYEPPGVHRMQGGSGLQGSRATRLRQVRKVPGRLLVRVQYRGSHQVRSERQEGADRDHFLRRLGRRSLHGMGESPGLRSGPVVQQQCLRMRGQLHPGQVVLQGHTHSHQVPAGLGFWVPVLVRGVPVRFQRNLRQRRVSVDEWRLIPEASPDGSPSLTRAKSR